MLANIPQSGGGSSSKITAKRALMFSKPTLRTLRSFEHKECSTGLPFARLSIKSPYTQPRSGYDVHAESPSMAPHFTFAYHYDNAEKFLDMKGVDIVEPIPPTMRMDQGNSALLKGNKERKSPTKLKTLSKPIDSSLMTRRKLRCISTNPILARSMGLTAIDPENERAVQKVTESIAKNGLFKEIVLKSLSNTQN